MDLSLNLGDLEITQVEQDYQNVVYYDLNLDDDTTSLTNIVERTLQTPYRYIRLYIETERVLQEIDGTYGCKIYENLSEPFTSSVFLNIQNDIQEALSILSTIPEIAISNVSLTGYDYTLYSLDVSVEYSLNDTPTTSTISIST